MENLRPEDLRAFAENPQAAADNLYKNLVSSMNDVPAQQPKTRAEVAEVRENAKDAIPVQGPVNF